MIRILSRLRRWHRTNQIGARTILVTGDIPIHWMLAKPRRVTAPPPHWSNEVTAAATCQAGGAALLAKLVEKDAEAGSQGRNSWSVYRPRLTSKLLEEKPPSVVDPSYNHAFSIWQPCGEKVDDAKNRKPTCWRMTEFQGNQVWNDRDQGLRRDYVLEKDDAGAEIVVLVDAGLGFNKSANEKLWPTAIRPGAQVKWVILRLIHSKPGSDLWHHLVKHFVDRLIVLTSVQDLRQMEAQISKKLSWERTAQETVREIRDRKNMHKLSRCRWVAVSIGQSGAVLVPGRSNRRACPKLVFDPQSMEDEWERRLEGSVLGTATCMTAALVHEVMKKPEDPDLVEGLKRGILAWRRLHKIGFGPPIDRPPDNLPTKLEFPFDKIVSVLQDSDKGEQQESDNGEGLESIGKLAEVEVKQFNARNRDWTILETKHPATKTKPLEELAIDIVIRGVENALPQVPICRFGDFVTVCRQEIEAVRSVARLMDEYTHRRADRAPLCIGVFGPPGAGKSFAVTQVAEETLLDVTPIEFNLSQFENPDSPDSLFKAFHRVRDEGLKGKLPLVVWDEFDTSGLKWLRFFLQPMQNGTFQQGEIRHPIGRCIFVFAGSTAKEMKLFAKGLDPGDKKLLKVRDFVSRLHGYMNVHGPNRRTSKDVKDRGWEKDDPYFIIRRAVILRGILEARCLRLMRGNTVNVDPGVLRAFLNAQTYEHGIRSMQSIVKMSLLAGLQNFEISSLPPCEQLDLHVSESKDFLKQTRPRRRRMWQRTQSRTPILEATISEMPIESTNPKAS